MLNYNFNPETVAGEMTNSWKGYHLYSPRICRKALYIIIYEFTRSKVKAYICAFIFSYAMVIFAKVKHHKIHHKHLFVKSATVCAYFLLIVDIKKAHKIGSLLYEWFWQDRKAHGYMTSERDEALMHVESEIFNLDPELLRTHATLFSEACVMFDPYEYHEVENGPWHEAELKLRESFRELKRVLSK